MPVKTYSLRQHGNNNVIRSDGEESIYFRVHEFACKDGADEIPIDTSLVDILDELRERFGRIIITSGYRTPSHNLKIGGATKSPHLDGIAADTSYIVGTDLKEVAAYAIYKGAGGVGYYPPGDKPSGNFVHIDTRDKPFYWRGHSNTRVETWLTSEYEKLFMANPTPTKIKPPVWTVAPDTPIDIPPVVIRVTAIINGKPMVAYHIDGKVYVPAREGFAAYDVNAKVDWDNINKVVTIS